MLNKEKILKEINFIKETSFGLIKENNKEIPIVCVILDESGNRMSLGLNRVEEDGCLTSHAEINAINKVKKNNFKGCTIIVNLEPCLMCLGAIITNGFSDLYYLVRNNVSGGITKYDIHSNLVDHYLDDKDEEEKLKYFFKKMREE